MQPLIGLTCSTLDEPALASAPMCGTPYRYLEWIERAGGVPVLLPNVGPELVDRLLAGLDGVLFTGGEDVSPIEFGCEPIKQMGTVDVPRDRFELPLARAALASNLPILGICRGVQLLAVAAGGTMRQDLVSDEAAWIQHRMKTKGGRTVHHHVDLVADSRAATVLGATRLAVNSYHHQAVHRPGAGWRVSGTAPDGVVEATEGTGELFRLGVQWHPEVMSPDHEPSQRLFTAFVAACGQQGEK